MVEMKLVILLSCIFMVQADVTQRDVVVDGVRYKAEILYDNLDRPNRLIVDFTTNYLYFCYRKNRNYYTGKFNINTKEFEDIQGLIAGTATAVDQETRDVYLGGARGIYKYNFNSKRAELVGTNGENNIMWKMFFKKVLYFIALPSNLIYTFANGRATRFEDLTYVENFVIDNNDVMYFNNITGLYRQEKGTKDAVIIENVPVVKALNTDKNGNVYACTSFGIYKAIDHSARFLKVIDDDDIFPTGIAFDSDNNIIYSDTTKIVRLTPKRSLAIPI